MEELKTKAKEVRDMVDNLNELTKDMEGQGCVIKYTVGSPSNKIDFVSIEKTTKF